jgi:hypothetical protein
VTAARADVEPQADVTLRSVLAGPIVAVVTALAALWGTHQAGVAFSDPDHVGARRLGLVVCLALVLVALDIVVRGARRTPGLRPSLAGMKEVRRDRWTRQQGIAVGSALVGFYVTYVAYRNLKSVLPLLRPGELYDRQLADFDRMLFFGHDPATVLHGVLGTGVATQVLSSVYVAFVFLMPLSLAFALVFASQLRGGLYYATALSINWGLGAASYLLLPARGPIYYQPQHFAALPDSHASYLQGLLLDERREFFANPHAPGAAQNIAAFASLHCSLLFTAAMAAQLLGIPRRLRIGLWVLFAVSAVSTVFLGWHYVIDDVAGVAIAFAALGLARLLTGIDPRTARRRRTSEQPI